MRNNRLARALDGHRWNGPIHPEAAIQLYRARRPDARVSGQEVARRFGLLAHYTSDLGFLRMVQTGALGRPGGTWLTPTPYAGCMAPYDLGSENPRDALFWRVPRAKDRRLLEALRGRPVMPNWVEQLVGLVRAAAREAKLPELEADGAFDGDALVWTWVAPEGGRRARAMLRAQLDAFGEHVSMWLLASADLAEHPEVTWTEAYPVPRVRVSSFETPTEMKALEAEVADRLRTAWSDARRNAGRLETVKERRGAATSWVRKAAKEFGFTIDER